MSTQFQIDAFFEQFPFLLSFRDDKKWGIDEVEVRRISMDLLERIPTYYSMTGSMVSIHERDLLILLSQNGEVLGEVKPTENFQSHYSDIQDSYRPGESVGNAVKRLNIADRLSYILEINYGHICRNHRSLGRRIVLHKPPKGWTVTGWVEEEKGRAANLISAQVKAVDSV